MDTSKIIDILREVRTASTEDIMVKLNRDIQTEVDFDGYFRSIGSPKLPNEFYGKPGYQHYRLLAYLSTLCNNTTILDVGTQFGDSAFALSYNTTNVVHSLDIENMEKGAGTLRRDNIRFHYDNLFGSTPEADAARERWTPLILSSPLIFLDVDPHNGTMEWEFFQFLCRIGYRGVMVCDDILHFEAMRIEFWDRIQEVAKYNFTSVGHWSGCGILDFTDRSLCVVTP